MNEQIDSFNRSFERTVEGRDFEFFDSFYHRFLGASAVAAQKFSKTNMKRQKEMMRASLIELMQFYVSGVPNEYMKRVAAIHGRSAHNITRAHYLEWLDSLLETVKEFDPEFDDNVELAWRVILSPGIAYLSHY